MDRDDGAGLNWRPNELGGMAELILEVRDFEDSARWRWVLTEPDGAFVADHQVRLDRDGWQFEAFDDLHAYLRWRVPPDRRVEQEAEIVAEMGEWIGAEVLGAIGPELVARAPVTVRVMVPANPVAARRLVFLPLALAHVRGKPIALRDVTLVVQLGPSGAARRTTGVGDRLRVLGLFSVPDGGRPLNLRGERRALVRLFRELARVDRQALDVHVLQYGVTRERLRELLAQPEGWDIVHISGHGAPGELLLEAEDGSPDRIDAAELAELLDATRERLRLITVSACWSAGPIIADQRRLLGLPTTGEISADDDVTEAITGWGQAGGTAVELVDRLGCAVLAMRYPVTDTFAIRLAEQLYGLLVGGKQSLPQVLAAALTATVTVSPSHACPALSARRSGTCPQAQTREFPQVKTLEIERRAMR